MQKQGKFLAAALGLVAAATSVLWTGTASAWDNELPAWATERRIIGPNQLEKIEKAAGTKAYDYARAVARVEDADGQGFCTAWRVAADLFITNHHCHDIVPCNQLQFHLGAEDSLSETEQEMFQCEEFLFSQEEHDVAVFRVKPRTLQPLNEETTLSSSKLELAPVVVKLWNGPIREGQLLQVAGHPAGRTKEIDRGPDCKIRTITPIQEGGRETITHTCDTEGGSSGSPVVDRQTGYAVALHWGGDSGFNYAIPMNLVVATLREGLDAAVFNQLTIIER